MAANLLSSGCIITPASFRVKDTDLVQLQLEFKSNMDFRNDTCIRSVYVNPGPRVYVIITLLTGNLFRKNERILNSPSNLSSKRFFPKKKKYRES